jgi:flagellar hook-basal body complex protein FliE
MSVMPVLPVDAASARALRPVALAAPAQTSFAGMLTNGIADTEAKVTEADRLARAFVLDDSIPVHQVTYAIEQARQSMELMLQVRSRLMEGYQQLMNMQL